MLFRSYPEEPTALRFRWRDEALDGDDWGNLLSGEGGFDEWLWSHWGEALEPAGFGRDALVVAVSDYRQEVWLWLLGDRTWAHCISGLAGRVLRRLPEPS